VEELFNYVNTKTLVVGGCGLREGLFYDYYGKHYLGGNPIIDDILVHSAENVLLGMTKHELVHAKYITGLATTLFDELEPLHKADNNARRCLITASLLHDIGKRVNYYSHARHGCYMLVNSNLYGISHVEQAFSAFLVMNSHGLTPKEYKNFLYGKLLDQEQRSLGQKLSIILGQTKGSVKFAVPTATALAPAEIKSITSHSSITPPIPIIGILTACAT